MENIETLEQRLQHLQQQLKEEQNKTKTLAQQLERIKIQVSKDNYDDVVWFHWKKANVINKSGFQLV